MDCSSRLVPEHFPRGQHHSVSQPLVALDEERPGLSDGLVQVDDGRDDVGVEPVHVGGEPGPVGVAPHSIGASVL